MNKYDEQADILFHQYESAVRELKTSKYNSESFGVYGNENGVIESVKDEGFLFRQLTISAKKGLYEYFINTLQPWLYSNAKNFERPWSYYYNKIYEICN